MRIKFKPWAKDYINQNPEIFILSDHQLKSLINQYEGVDLEIGCGKGQFSIKKAQENPNRLYIALERYDSVIVKAGQKKAQENVKNLYFYSGDIKELCNKKFLRRRINNIYLNFSDPWPKTRHEKRRLTSPGFIKIYDFLLKREGNIYLKTDNQNFFEYSLTSLSTNRFAVVDVCLDLHKTARPNIKTEYEEKFSERGFTIKYAQFKRARDIK